MSEIETEVKQVSEFEKKNLFDPSNIAALIDKSKIDSAEVIKKNNDITQDQEQNLETVGLTLSEEDVAEIKEMFKEIDVDGSGSITSEELQKVLKEQGAKLHEAVTHVMVAMADTDGDGQINFEEFVQMTIAG